MTIASEYLAQVSDCMEASTARLRDAFEHSIINNRKAKDYSFSDMRQPMFPFVRQLIIPDSAGYPADFF